MNRNQCYWLSLLAIVTMSAISCYPPFEDSRPLSISVGACSRCTQPIEQRKVAIMVEPRKHPLIVPIAKEIMAILPSDWIIQIFHGSENKEFIRNSELMSEIVAGKIVLSEMNTRNLSLAAYNTQIHLNPYFWEKVLGENVLLVETDAILCRESPYKIDDFLHYDYIGAPWTGSAFKTGCHIATKNGATSKYVFWVEDVDAQSLLAQGFNNIKTIERPTVGNSGLSFRKRSKMLRLLQQYIPASDLYFKNSNDFFVSCAIQDGESGFAVPNGVVAQTFSTESMPYNGSFGVHKPWIDLPKGELIQLATNCTGLRDILLPHYHL